MCHIDGATATGVHIDAVVFVAFDGIEDGQRSAGRDRDGRQSGIDVGDRQRIEALATEVDRVYAAINCECGIP